MKVIIIIFVCVIFGIASIVSFNDSNYLIAIAQAVISLAIAYVLKKSITMNHSLIINQQTYNKIIGYDINTIVITDKVSAGDTIFLRLQERNRYTGHSIEVYVKKTYQKRGEDNIAVTFEMRKINNPRVQGDLF